MDPAQTTLANLRLRLGIVNVGCWVLAASAGLLYLLSGGTRTLDLRWYLLIAFGSVAVQAVFDFIGGTLLMPAPEPTVAEFFRGWLPGVLGHTLALAVVGGLSYACFRFTGGYACAILLAAAGQIFARRFFLHFIGGAPTTEVAQDGTKILVADAADPAFTGGIVGFGVRAASVWPVNWRKHLSAEELASESLRRSWQAEHGLAGRTLVLILGWNVLGASIGSFAFHLAERSPGEALFGYACWMTLWAFGSLLILPSFSRKAVFAADRAVIDAGHDPRGWITRFPSLVGEDGGSNAAVQTIFYPVPSARMRRSHLEKPTVGFIPGSLARSNLYYSWSTFTMLGRAVHCNVGRPALWVFPPSA